MLSMLVSLNCKSEKQSHFSKEIIFHKPAKKQGKKQMKNPKGVYYLSRETRCCPLLLLPPEFIFSTYNSDERNYCIFGLYWIEVDSGTH
jgi:hypothetical protein